MCNRLVSIGILDAVVLENGEYGYIVTTLGLNYYSTTPANDPVARLLASMMLATLNS
jgi:hypothetical protein